MCFSGHVHNLLEIYLRRYWFKCAVLIIVAAFRLCLEPFKCSNECSNYIDNRKWLYHIIDS